MTRPGISAQIAATAAWPGPDDDASPVPSAASRSFSVPGELDETLTQVLTYWNGLKRGNAEVPFADDVKLGDIWKLSNKIALVHVLASGRLRFDVAGRQLVRSYGSDLAGRIADELPVRPPLDDFLSQCRATIDARAPSFYRHEPAVDGHGAYGRILLPLWADGRIAALLGAVNNW